jgi:signal transduction histidine kinase
MEETASVGRAPVHSSNGDFAAALESAKLQALYNFAYGLSHEINNPLANISARAQTLLVDESNPERRRKLATIVQQAFRAHEMIADLMLFARPPAMRPEEVDLSALADTIVAEMQEAAAEQGTQLIRGGDAGPLMGTVDPNQIAVALKALIQNSLEALRQGGQIEVLSTQYSVPSTADNYQRIDYPQPTPAPNLQSAICNPQLNPSPASNLQSAIRNLQLSVTDTGPGIPPEIRPHIFDPFFSGREAGRGLGLGLSKAWRIVNLHGGTIEVENAAAGGARFTIALPTAD